MFRSRVESALNLRRNAAGSATGYSVRTFQSGLWNALGPGAGRGSIIGITQEVENKEVADCDRVRAEAANFSI